MGDGKIYTVRTGSREQHEKSGREKSTHGVGGGGGEERGGQS